MGCIEADHEGATHKMGKHKLDHSRPRGLAESGSGMTSAQQIGLDYVQPEKWQPKSWEKNRDQTTEPHPFMLDPQINPRVHSEEFLQKLRWGVALTRLMKSQQHTVELEMKKFPPAFAQKLRLQ